MSCIRAVLLALALATFVACTGTAPLRFSIPEGRLRNEFFRDGPIAAHVVLRSGVDPRVVIAFPAGNSGAALWLDAGPDRLEWQEPVRIEPATQRLADGGMLRGVRVTVSAAGGSVHIARAITGSVRSLRDYEHTLAVPDGVEVEPVREGARLTWRRRRLDGAAGYLLALDVRGGRLVPGDAGTIALAPGEDGALTLEITAMTGDAPLAPLEDDRLLTAQAAQDPRLRRILAFLSYEDKLLAGSWRFNTYFGRDTLMALRLLAPVLRPNVTEAGLASVLERLAPDGEVAHEEDIGEYAVLRRLATGGPADASPLYDYKMVDDDFMLAIVAAHYLLEAPDGRRRASSFLSRRTASGEPWGSALVRNLRFVVRAAARFAEDPDWRHMIALKPGELAGNWRDSREGLGGGRYSYDVNAVLVPAALAAISRLEQSGLLAPYLDREATAALRAAEAMANVWRSEAPRLFEFRLTQAEARASLRAYAASVRIDPAPASAAVGPEGIRFHAVALDSQGRPIAVQNSDESFALLFLEPGPAEVASIARTLTRPFPAGLLTGAGLLVANPAFADRRLWPSFARDRYHGTVVWSWHQALLRAGIDRQLARDDLPDDTCAALADARARLEDAIRATREMRGAELWSWSQSDGRFAMEPFGQSAGHETESNAAQLWSTVHLALP